MNIGVLALQGDFKEHLQSLHKHGIEGLEIRTKADLNQVDALIIPGGESTVIAKLLKSTGLDQEIIKRAKEGMPIWGSCAGAILLAKKVKSQVELETGLGLLDMEIDRNSYGRQTESFKAKIKVEQEKVCKERKVRKVRKESKDFEVEVMFIRAPRIIGVGRWEKVLAECKGDPVLVRRGKILASTFHSELKYPDHVLECFLGMVK